MKIALITPGTGTFYCGVCLRDEALAKVLRSQGHEVYSVPVYLPLVHEGGSPTTERHPEPEVFFGGINAYLQQVLPLFRRTPRALDRLFDHPAALGFAARMGEMTNPTKLGAMTLSMLQGEAGRQHKELKRMVDELSTQASPDLICLATALQAGMIRSLKAAFPKAAIACFFQGEDEFIDALQAGYSERCWAELSTRCEEADFLFAPSRYFLERLSQRLTLKDKSIQILPNGIDLSDFPQAYQPRDPESAAPVIGYLARMCPEKGLDILIDAFIQLHQKNPTCRARLRVMGVLRRTDEDFLKVQETKLEQAGILDNAEFLPNVSRAEKIAGLTGCSLFSVPARYSEAFGLYVAEALAAGIPCVLPRHAAFAELVEHQTHGLIYEPHTPEALAEALAVALGSELEEWGAAAHTHAREHFAIECVAAALLQALTSAVAEG